MAARRQRNRQRRRRGRFGFLYQLLSVLVVFAAILVGCVIFFRVNSVEVEGNVRYSAQEIIDASGVKVGDNLFLVNRPRTNSAIIQKLPYIQKAAMVRRLPDTIELHITESAAAAVVTSDAGSWIIDPRGKLLEEAGNLAHDDLPLVYGLTPTEPQVGAMMTVTVEEQTNLEGLRNLLTALADRDLTARLRDFIDLRDTNTIYFGCGEDLTVAVPLTGDFSQKAFALQRVLETFEQRGERCAGTLYLTYGEAEARLLVDRWLPAQ